MVSVVLSAEVLSTGGCSMRPRRRGGADLALLFAVRDIVGPLSFKLPVGARALPMVTLQDG
jgi:hypothetical protein